MRQKLASLKSVLSSRDLFTTENRISVAVCACTFIVISLFLLPISPWLLDLLIVANLSFSSVLFIKVLFTRNFLDLYTFPVLLLFATLFRLSLNVCSTRLILLQGEQGIDSAGEVIGAFGEFVVSNNFVVGVVIFVIIALVNFLVIARGASRVAEVAARFSLDALPGRQLSIDSDLRSGVISRAEANALRSNLSKESRFLGSMDGAMKFVQGDAIAGMIIALVNGIGGVSIGVGRGLSVSESINTFGVLTIGDGLASVLPSLIVAVASGVAVTSGFDKKGRTGNSVAKSLVTDPFFLALTGVGVAVIGFIPGFPVLPFLISGSVLCSLAYMKRSKLSDQNQYNLRAIQREHEDYPSELFSSQSASANVEIASGSLETQENLRSFLFYLSELAEEVYQEKGFRVKSIGFRKSIAMDEDSFQVFVRGVRSAKEKIILDGLYCLTTSETVEIMGGRVIAEVIDPISSQSAVWVLNEFSVRKALGILGVTILEAPQVQARAVVGAWIKNSDLLWGVAEIKEDLLSPRGDIRTGLIDEVFDEERLTYPEYAEIIRRLVSDGVSVRDPKVILQGIAEFICQWPRTDEITSWLEEMHRYIRKCLSKHYLREVIDSSGNLNIITLSESIEDVFGEASSRWDHGRDSIPLAPDFIKKFSEKCESKVGPLLRVGIFPVVLICNPGNRFAIQTILNESSFSNGSIRVFGFDELSIGCSIRPVSTISIEE